MSIQASDDLEQGAGHGPPPERAEVEHPPGIAISIRDLSKSFGRRASDREYALANVDLDVREGEFLVLLGPSGCGKTTLLRSIAGLERPDSGSIEIEGQTMFDGATGVHVDGGRRPVAMIFQSYALWPHMTAARNVAFPLRCTHVPRAEIARRVDEMLTLVGIGELGGRYPAEMSGGQQQRLALARALVVGQRVVLFDEPLSNVDAQVRDKLRLELIKMQRTLGFTAIYVTHDQSEAMGLADRIAVMTKGRVAQLGSPRDLYLHPDTVDVARFLGQSNEVALTVEQFDGETGLIRGSGAIGRVHAVWRGREGGSAPAPGERIVAFSRPGDFMLTTDGRDDSGDPASVNAWRGTVEAARFFGTHVEYVVRIGELRVRCWRADERGGAVAEGREVRVSVEPHDLYAVRER